MDARVVIKWLMFGVLLFSLVRALMPPEMFSDYFGPTFLGLLLTVLVATILEVCSEGSTPIAADILTQAKAPGNGFAFLMSGVATDYTEIMIFKKRQQAVGNRTVSAALCLAASLIGCLASKSSSIIRCIRLK